MLWRRSGCCFSRSATSKPSMPGSTDIHQDRIGTESVHSVQCHSSVVGNLDIMPVELQDQGQTLTDETLSSTTRTGRRWQAGN